MAFETKLQSKYSSQKSFYGKRICSDCINYFKNGNDLKILKH
jgi:hypothetical protein